MLGPHICLYRCILVVFKLLPDKGVKSPPVRTGQVASDCPQVAEYKGVTEHTVEMLGVLTQGTPTNTRQHKTENIILLLISVFHQSLTEQR